MLENGRDCIKCWNKELVSWDKSELNFEDNCTCFSWLLDLDFISSALQDELRRNSFKEKASLVTIPTQIKTLREERMLQVLLLLLPLLLSFSIRGKLISIKLGTKHYIPKISKFYVEKGYLVYVMAHQQITFSTLNRFYSLR